MVYAACHVILRVGSNQRLVPEYMVEVVLALEGSQKKKSLLVTLPFFSNFPRVTLPPPRA